jgi:hypothetical protein
MDPVTPRLVDAVFSLKELVDAPYRAEEAAINDSRNKPSYGG